MIVRVIPKNNDPMLRIPGFIDSSDGVLLSIEYPTIIDPTARRSIIRKINIVGDTSLINTAITKPAMRGINHPILSILCINYSRSQVKKRYWF